MKNNGIPSNGYTGENTVLFVGIMMVDLAFPVELSEQHFFFNYVVPLTLILHPAISNLNTIRKATGTKYKPWLAKTVMFIMTICAWLSHK